LFQTRKVILGSQLDGPCFVLVWAPVLETPSGRFLAALFPYDEACGDGSGMVGGVAGQESSLT